jgi:diguanylate cyclase (GGDEF)-like protein
MTSTRRWPRLCSVFVALVDMFGPRSNRLGNAFLIAFGLLLGYALISAVRNVRDSMHAEREKVIGRTALLVEHIDYELDYLLHGAKTMRNIADRYLLGRVKAVENPIRQLKPVPEHQAYVTDLPAGLDKDLPPTRRGRITGELPLPDTHDPVSVEMAMAIGMSPVMEALREHDPDIPWVYYTSARRFMFLFSEADAQAKGFYFKPVLMEQEFIARAGPQANPTRVPIWTRPYRDEAGKGTMVTLSQPVYQGDEFRGVISIDVSVQRLQRLLDMHPIPGAQVALFSDDEQALAQRGGEIVTSPREGTLLRLQNAPWQVRLRIDDRQMLLLALQSRTAQCGGVALLGVSFVFMLLLMRSERRIRELSIRDGLTGLHNRRHFDATVGVQFGGAHRGSYRLGLAIIDIDFFKKYNDRYGHQQGDAALKAVAHALRAALQRSSDQVFRIGGEEFAVMTHLKGDDTLEGLLERLNQAVRDLQLAHQDNATGHLTISIGGVVVDASTGLSPQEAYQQADAALYRAKASGRDRFVCNG